MRIFVTGASGFIGRALVPELLAAGHQVIGLARSDASAAALSAAGAEVQRGTLDDLEILRDTAAAADGVVHLAFKHDLAFSGGFQEAADADLRAIETLGEALQGSGKPLVIASGILGIANGRRATEDQRPGAEAGSRVVTANAALALAAQGVRPSIVRLSPTVHGEGDGGFLAALIAVARQKGVSGSIGDGQNRWPAVHVRDAATLFRLAAESAPADSVLHGVADEGVSIRQIAEVIGKHLKLPVVSVPAEGAGAHFGWLAGPLSADAPASNILTRELLHWTPTHPDLISDLEQGHYFTADS